MLLVEQAKDPRVDPGVVANLVQKAVQFLASGAAAKAEAAAFQDMTPERKQLRYARLQCHQAFMTSCLSYQPLTLVLDVHAAPICGSTCLAWPGGAACWSTLQLVRASQCCVVATVQLTCFSLS